ncbi:MAG: TolC family protein [Flavobacteriales bacterium]|nr:TolC family protein [Flavobacteriales bacterium]
MQQAGLQVDIADANLRLQQAVMDPYVSASYGDKAYDDKEYYTKSSLKLALPTALGVEFFAGYTENIGPQVDPEILTSSSGQYQAGVSLPLGPDLLFNERRLAIRKAGLMTEMADAERRLMVNDLFFRASLAYLNWSLANQSITVQEDALSLAEEQFQFVKGVFTGGDRPAIDTVEAFLQVQTRRFQLLESRRALNSAEIILSNFLWDQEGNPVRLADRMLPQSLEEFAPFTQQVQDSFMVWKEEITQQHPSILINQLAIQSLKLERQTAFSGAIPQIDLKYMALTPGVSNRDIQAMGINDRMFGVGLKYPLLIRKQRSKLSLIDLKRSEKELDLKVKSLGLSTKLDQHIMEYGINAQQADLYGEMVSNFDRLLRAERIKFSLGESSVFLLNARENKLFDAQAKQLETQAKQIGSIFKVIQTSNKEDIYLDAVAE